MSYQDVMNGLVDGYLASRGHYAEPDVLAETIRLVEGEAPFEFHPDANRLRAEGLLSETPTSHDTWMEAAGLLD